MIIIGIAGGSGSGKTTVVKRIAKALPPHCAAVIPLDSYYNDTTELTDEELELLADIVWLEAGNQGVVGQEYVVTVILNRTLDPDFEDKIIDVLSTDGQFVTWKNRYKAQPTEETYQAIEDVLSGKADESVTNSQFLYFNTKSGDYKYLGHYFSY